MQMQFQKPCSLSFTFLKQITRQYISSVFLCLSAGQDLTRYFNEEVSSLLKLQVIGKNLLWIVG